ncbi:polyprenyl synthetase family protein [Bdellovibrio sp. HCB337]|uniref:polyprenyl synthetase family protein n=1 Tax=Bdellovibrio sp. HCB337 TaxID=3394358 RepID=UPI0039A472A7
MIQFESELKKRIEAVDEYIHRYFHSMDLPPGAAILELKESMYYSAGSGGKRFRPVLSLLIGELFSVPANRILPFATAVELIHTYSLIHDDLPCMDNDDFRRGKPTNHKVYGETTALLAGDALLTEAFLLIAKEYKENGFLAAQLCELLSRAAGVRGMVGGQAIDLKAKNLSVEELTHLHNLKTGRMIQVAAEGAAIVAGASPKEIESLAKFGEFLGLAFQVADDILDHGEKDQEARSFTGLLGVEGTKTYLQEISEKALKELHKIPNRSVILEHMIEFNRQRQK